MNYDARTAAIGKLLREVILPRHIRPEHLDVADAQAEVRDMIEDLNAAWPIMPDSQFEATGKALARSLRMTYTGRSWPTIAHLAKALKAALAPPPSAASDGPGAATKLDILDIRREQLIAWCRGQRSCPAHLITRENLALLAKESVIRLDQVEDMLAFAGDAAGVAEDVAPDDRKRRDYSGVTIGFKRATAV